MQTGASTHDEFSRRQVKTCQLLTNDLEDSWSHSVRFSPAIRLDDEQGMDFTPNIPLSEVC
jgi:hypothetical protein